MCEEKFDECSECTHFCNQEICNACDTGEFFEEDGDLDFEEESDLDFEEEADAA